jgi:putative transposase
MIERTHPKLSVGAQCQLLSISRSSFYYAPQGETAMNLDLMLKVDKQFLDTPFYGVRQMTWHLQNEGDAVNEKRIRRLMRLVRLTPIYQKPNTSKPAKGHKTYPCLLAGLRIDRPNQVWCADITYLPMRKGFLYLVAIMDWFTHKVLTWRLSNTLEAEFCLEALNEAIHKFGPPEIMNTDQGSQFTSFDWTDRLKQAKTKISMDGKARYLDNPRAFPRTNGRNALDMSRPWRSLKYECVYLHVWETGSQAKAGVGRWITFYNHQRPHAAHGGQPPAVVYFNAIQTDQQRQAVA